jgi:hypothetical protein
MLIRVCMCRALPRGADPGAIPRELRQWRPPAGETRVKPVKACAALRSLTGYEFSILTANPHPANGDLPESCGVVGQVLPEVRFEVSLPASRNKRLLMIGNGGYAGENLDAPSRAAFRDEAIPAGFVAPVNVPGGRPLPGVARQCGSGRPPGSNVRRQTLARHGCTSLPPGPIRLSTRRRATGQGRLAGNS